MGKDLHIQTCNSLKKWVKNGVYVHAGTYCKHKRQDKKDGQEVVVDCYSEGQVGGTWDILLFTLNLFKFLDVSWDHTNIKFGYLFFFFKKGLGPQK